MKAGTRVGHDEEYQAEIMSGYRCKGLCCAYSNLHDVLDMNPYGIWTSVSYNVRYVELFTVYMGITVMGLKVKVYCIQSLRTLTHDTWNRARC